MHRFVNNRRGIAAAGADIDLEVYGKLTDRLGRTFQRLGLKRIASSAQTFGDALRADMVKQQRENADRAERNRQEFDQQQRKRGAGGDYDRDQ